MKPLTVSPNIYQVIYKKTFFFPLPASFQGAEAGLLPGRHTFPASGVLRGVERVTGVTRVSSRWQSWAVSQLSLGGIHDGHHPVPGGNQLFFNIVLVQQMTNISLLFNSLKQIRFLLKTWCSDNHCCCTPPIRMDTMQFSYIFNRDGIPWNNFDSGGESLSFPVMYCWN